MSKDKVNKVGGVKTGGDLTSFPQYLLLNAKRFANRPAMRHKDHGIWQSWTWSQMCDEIRAYSLGLEKLGLKRGDKIAIIGANRPKLYWTFSAAQALGAVPVPVYADSVAEEMAYVLEHAEVQFAVCQDQEQVDKILSNSENLPSLKKIIYDETRGLTDYDHSSMHSIDDVQELGRRMLADSTDAQKGWLKSIGEGKGDDLAVILYTSGTTGRPKGVMLRNRDCVNAAVSTVKFDGLNENDIALAYLPLAWVGDHYLSYAQGMVAGYCLACPESPDTVSQDLREIGPTFYFAPPRVFENLLTSVMLRMEDASAFKQRMFHYFLKVSERCGEDILNGKPVGLVDRILYGIGSILVYGPIRNVLGFSRVRIAYTAGEAIGPDLFSFFRSLGINLKQLYGQTEAFLYVTCQANGQVRADAVGAAAPDVDIRISDSGEVLFRSPGMFFSYFKDEEKTKETITSDGYIKTGDAGFVDVDGQLKIIDRAKDVGKLINGAMFAPKYIENKLKFFPNIKEVVAFGDGRECCGIFLNIDLAAVGNWAERNNISYASYQELASHPQVYKMMEEHVEQVNRDLAGEKMMAGSQISRFLVLHKELDADDGELTRTQKVRRNFIAERYEPLIEALYDGSTEKFVETEVIFEDGRKGNISATVQVRDVKTFPAAAMKEAAE
ncbi:MAG: AMP-binding protein [Rhizobiaceae bacterium]|nr:AMP-binding protein [Rhizobiaceae bacterium]